MGVRGFCLSVCLSTCLPVCTCVVLNMNGLSICIWFLHVQAGTHTNPNLSHLQPDTRTNPDPNPNSH